MKNVTDGSIFSVVKYLLKTYAPDDVQSFAKLNRDNAWENKKLVRLRGSPFLQNCAPGAVVAINNVYSRATHAVKEKRYRYMGIGPGKYTVTNMKNGNRYSFTLAKSDCSCVDSVTNVNKIPCIHSIFLILSLKLRWSYFELGVRRNIRNSLIKTTESGWTLLGPPEGSEDA